MTWLDSVLYGEAGLTFVLSGLNSASMAGLAARAASRARQVGASALAFVCAGVAMELAFLALAAPASEMHPAAVVALLLVRTLLLASTALLTALVLRAISQ